MDRPTTTDDETLRVWQPRYERDLTREDARAISENLVGFFRVIQEWAAAEDKNQPY